MTPIEILQVIAPEYASSPSATDFIELASLRTNSCFFGDKANYAIALRAAHMLTLSATRPLGEVGPVSSKSEGDLSISFGSVSGVTFSDLSQTSYGVELDGLIKGTGPILGITGENALQGGC